MKHYPYSTPSLILLNLQYTFNIDMSASGYAIGVVFTQYVLHIIFIIPMTVNDVNLSVAFKGSVAWVPKERREKNFSWEKKLHFTM